MKKRIEEQRQKREQERLDESEKSGVDIDLIKNWIHMNTQKMLLHRDVKERMEANISERERIEDEMLAEGDKLIDSQIKMERLEMEKESLENEQNPDEGKIYEIEEEMDRIQTDIKNFEDELDSKDQTLSFINKKIGEYAAELQQLDIENIEPLNFKGLQSVDAARITLQTFFAVLLDLNVYKRDLEQKCIEQDEAILGLNEKIGVLQDRIEQLTSNGEGGSKTIDIHKEKALKNIVEVSEVF